MSTVNEVLGCGVATHDESCLCDVVIVNPLPPLSECFRDAVDEMWMGKQLCNLKGYCVPWTNESILDYLEDLKKFYDEFHSLAVAENGQSLYEIGRLVWDSTEMSHGEWWNHVRKTVQYCMDNFDDSLCDIIESLGLSPQEFMDIATAYTCGEWDRERLDNLDKLFSGNSIVLTEIAAASGLTVPSVSGIRKYWLKRREKRGLTDNPAKKLLHELCADEQYHGLPPRKIVAIIKDATGYEYTSGAVTTCRKRIKIQLTKP